MRPLARAPLRSKLAGPRLVAYYPDRMNPEAFSKIDPLFEKPEEADRLEKLERRKKAGSEAASAAAAATKKKKGR